MKRAVLTALALSAFVIENTLDFVGSVPYFKRITGGLGILDMLPLPNPERAHRALALLGADGRRQYAILLVTFDILFPLTLALFFRAWLGNRLRWLPWATLGLDYTENAVCGLLLATFPLESATVASLAGIITALKTLGYAACLIALGLTAWESARGRLAMAIAKELANRLHGAVYDPQADEVVWPRSRKHVYVAPSEEARIRVVDLSWYVEGGDAADELPAQLLQGLRAACPEALPRRYGDYEPLQHKMDPGCEIEFVNFWRDLEANSLPKMLFWKAQSPCFGGNAHFPDKRAKYPNGRPVGVPGTKRCTKISLDFDGRALHGDERWCSAVVKLFSSMATRLGAFYAAAHVQRNVIAKQGLWPEPMDVDQLATRFPPLPARLIYASRDDAPPGEPRVVPAEFIPTA